MDRVSVYRNFLYAACLVSAGCATTSNRVVTPRCDPTDTCFNRNNVRSFEVLDRETIIVEVGSGRCRFLVEVDGIMCDVAVTGRVGFLDSDGRICAADNSLLIMDPFLRNSTDDVCRIRDVRAVSDDELLERYASLGRIPPLPPVGSGEVRVEANTEVARPESAGNAAGIDSAELGADSAVSDAAPISSGESPD